MQLVVVGINHKTAPVETRELFSFSADKVVEANRSLKGSGAFRENLVVSTCNRVEVYAVAGHDQDSANDIKLFLSRYHGLNALDHDGSMYVHKNKDAVAHLFRVVSGLDSMIIGEAEIMAQMKKAYSDAKAALATGKVLNRLFEKAFNTAKKIRTQTFISRGVVSVSSAAIRLSEKILGGLGDKTALVIGTGTVGEQLIVYLKKNGIRSILAANRTMERAEALARKFAATPIAFEDFRSRLAEVDIVITSTGAPHAIVRKDDIASLMPRRKQKPLFIIDLAVPRDVEESVNTIDNAYLYNIDDLQKIVDENLKLRQGELDNCSGIIAGAADRFMAWLANEKIAHAQ